MSSKNRNDPDSIERTGQGGGAPDRHGRLGEVSPAAAPSSAPFEAEPEPDHAPGSPYFGQSEISHRPAYIPTDEQHAPASAPQPAQADDDALTSLAADPEFLRRTNDKRGLDGLIAAALAASSGKGLFRSWPKKIAAMSLGYPIYLELLRGGDKAIDATLAHEYFADRERLPPRKNPAHIALLLAARAEDEPEQKACSAYSIVLEYAAAKGIHPAEFIEEVSKKKFYQIKDAVGPLRKAAKARSTKELLRKSRKISGGSLAAANPTGVAACAAAQEERAVDAVVHELPNDGCPPEAAGNSLAVNEEACDPRRESWLELRQVVDGRVVASNALHVLADAYFGVQSKIRAFTPHGKLSEALRFLADVVEAAEDANALAERTF